MKVLPRDPQREVAVAAAGRLVDVPWEHAPGSVELLLAQSGRRR